MDDDAAAPAGAGRSAAATADPEAPRAADRAPGGAGHRPWWAFPVVVLAALAVAAAAYWGVRGLFGNPIRGTDASGVTTIEGSWEPYDCGSPCVGNVQDGGRSVTVILPSECPEPARASDITVRGRLDTSQGSGTYRAVACPTS